MLVICYNSVIIMYWDENRFWKIFGTLEITIKRRIEKYKCAPWVCKSLDFFNTFILIYPYLYTVVAIIIIIIINYIIAIVA